MRDAISKLRQEEELKVDHENTSSVKMPKFPLELIENIIDYLSNDTTSLRSCSLTCHAWFPRSHYHLFSALSVKGNDRLAELIKFAAASGTESMSFLPLVRSLDFNHIDWSYSRVDEISLVVSNANPLARDHIMASIMSRAIDDYPRLFTSLKNVSHLQLWSCEFRDFKQLAEAICRFPRLNTLVLDTVAVRDDEPEDNAQCNAVPVTSHVSHPSISHLSIASDCDPVIFSQLAIQPFLQTLRLLSLTITAPDSEHGGRLIAAMGPHLEHLDLDPDLFIPMDRWQFLNLDKCHALYTFAMHELFRAELIDVFSLLSPCSRIRVVELRLHVAARFQPFAITCRRFLNWSSFLSCRSSDWICTGSSGIRYGLSTRQRRARIVCVTTIQVFGLP